MQTLSSKLCELHSHLGPELLVGFSWCCVEAVIEIGLASEEVTLNIFHLGP